MSYDYGDLLRSVFHYDSATIMMPSCNDTVDAVMMMMMKLNKYTAIIIQLILNQFSFDVKP